MMSNETKQRTGKVSVQRLLWILMACASALFFLNSLVNASVRTSIEDIKNLLNLDDTQLQMSVTSAFYFLSVPLSLVGSVIVDRLGVSRSILLFGVGSLTGWILFCTALSFRLVWLVTLARVIYGGSLSALVVASNYFCIYWFESRGLLSISMGIFRVLNGIAGTISPLIILNLLSDGVFKLKVTTVQWILCSPLVLALFFGFALVSFSKYLESVISNNQVNDQTSSIVELEEFSDQQNVKSAEIAEQTEQLEEPDSGTDGTSETIKKSGISQYLSIVWSLVKQPSFFVLILVGFTLEGSTVSFFNVIRSYLQRYFKFSSDRIGFLMGMIRIPGLFSPLIGWLLDRFFVKHPETWHMSWLCGAALTVLFGHLIAKIGDTQLMGLTGFIVLGMGYVAYEISFWTCVSELSQPCSVSNLKVSEKRKRKVVAVGLMNAVLCFSSILFPIVGGSIISNHDGSDESKESAFRRAHFLYIVLGSAAVFFSFLVFFIRRMKRKNELPSAETGGSLV